MNSSSIIATFVAAGLLLPPVLLSAWSLSDEPEYPTCSTDFDDGEDGEAELNFEPDSDEQS